MKTETTPSPPTVASADLLDAARIQERERYGRLLEHEGKQEAASLKNHMYMIWLDDYKRLGDEWIAAFRAYRDQLKSASNTELTHPETKP